MLPVVGVAFGRVMTRNGFTTALGSGPGVGLLQRNSELDDQGVVLAEALEEGVLSLLAPGTLRQHG